jgi:putative tricarboxylic transport membrane protein
MHPETFGKGNIEGVIASESAINASDGSHLIPTLGFGMPAGAEMAVFLGILMLHGLQPRSCDADRPSARDLRDRLGAHV